MPTPYTPPEFTRYSRSEWQEAAATPRGADMILNPERYAQYVSSGPLIGANSTRVAPDVELRRDFRNRPDEFGELMTTAARTDPEAALKSNYLIRLGGGIDVMRNALATVSPSTAQEVVAHWANVGTGTGGREFLTMAATVQPEAVLRGMSGYEGTLRYANWDEQAMLTAARTLVERDPQRALTLANELTGSEYMMNRTGMDAVVAALANGQEVTPARVARRQGERGDVAYDQALAEQRGVPVEEIRAAQTAPSSAMSAEPQPTTAERLGIDASDGFSAREKQSLLEAAGFATDGGRNARADGLVDGRYGAASRAAEQNFSIALVGGSLNGVDPEVLRMAREAFSPSITNAVNAAATEAAAPAVAAGVVADRSQGAER